MVSKIAYHYLLPTLLLWCIGGNLAAQRLSKSTYRTLNNYLVYSNEVTHALNLMYFDFLYLNEQFYQYVEQQDSSSFSKFYNPDGTPKAGVDVIQTLSYKKDNILTNPEYFPTYPRDLYPDLNDNIYLPYDKRGVPLQLIGKVKKVLDEVEGIRGDLETYINSNQYQQDTNLTQGFARLQRAEVLFYDLFTLQEKLHWSLTAIAQSYTTPVIDSNALRTAQSLQPLLNQVKRTIKSVRANDKSRSIQQNGAQLRSLYLKLEREKDAILGGLERDSTSLRSPDQRFDAMILRAKCLWQATRNYQLATQYNSLAFEPHYYFYNIDLLQQYNRINDGLATLFNKFIDENDVYWLYEHEMPQLFEVRYPDIPAYNIYQAPEIDIETFLAARFLEDSLRQARIQDSICTVQTYLDSIAYRKVHPEIGDMNLTGFATNNLVFLLDVSASMKDTSKLPLLKEALIQLLDLMRQEDNITLITYSGKAQLVLPPTGATAPGSKEKILSVIDQLASSGTSDANKGIQLAYTTIEASFIKDGNNRIILATDGAIKVSNRIKRLIKRNSHSKAPIKLSTFYFSHKEFTHHKQLLQELSNIGAGSYRYIQKNNAKKILIMEAQKVREQAPNLNRKTTQ